MEENKPTRAKIVKNVIFFVLLCLSVTVATATPFLDGKWRDICDLLVRGFAAGAILFLLSAEGALVFGARLFPRTTATRTAAMLIFLVALNNFPFFDLLTHRASVAFSSHALFFYALSSAATAAFEESLFRGLLFPLIREKTKRTFRGELAALFFSSAIFALLHLVNLIEAPLPATLLQVTYTFGIGLLSGLLYLFSRGLLLPILFHAIYNFGGLFLPTFGKLPPAAPFTVLSTFALAATAAVFAVLALRDFAREEKK